MQAKLSWRTIHAVRPNDNPFEVVDSELKGFLLRVQPSGVMSYYFSYRNDQGIRKRYRIGSSESVSPAQARDQAILLSARVVAGDDIQAEKKRERKAARLVFVFVHFDDWVCDYQPEYFAQIDEHLLRIPIEVAELVFCPASNLFGRTFTMKSATVLSE